MARGRPHDAPATAPAGSVPAIPIGARLGVAAFDRPVLTVARDLLGCVLRVGETAGVVVETEAYHDSEAACHAHIGLTARTAVLIGPPGRAYVYRSYGIHALLNCVCEPDGVGAAVLIRALEPVAGTQRMRARRGVARDVDLSNGPGKLTRALGVELGHNGSSLTDGPIALEAGPFVPDDAVFAAERVGITKAAELPWRFALASPFVSRPWPPGLREALRRREGEAPS